MDSKLNLPVGMFQTITALVMAWTISITSSFSEEKKISFERKFTLKIPDTVQANPEINYIDVSNDGNYLVILSYDRKLGQGVSVVWNLKSQQQVDVSSVKGEKYNSASFSPKSDMLAIASSRAGVRVSELKSGKVIGRFSAQEGRVILGPDTRVVFSISGEFIYVIERGGRKRKKVGSWEDIPFSEDEIKNAFPSGDDRCNQIDGYENDSPWMVIHDGVSKIKVIQREPKPERVVGLFNSKALAYEYQDVALSSNAQRLAYKLGDNYYVWNISDNSEQLLECNDVKSAALSSSGDLFAVIGKEEKCVVYQLSTQSRVFISENEKIVQNIRLVHWMSDSSTLITAQSGGIISLWNKK